MSKKATNLVTAAADNGNEQAKAALALKSANNRASVKAQGYATVTDAMVALAAAHGEPVTHLTANKRLNAVTYYAVCAAVGVPYAASRNKVGCAGVFGYKHAELAGKPLHQFIRQQTDGSFAIKAQAGYGEPHRFALCHKAAGLATPQVKQADDADYVKLLGCIATGQIALSNELLADYYGAATNLLGNAKPAVTLDKLANRVRELAAKAAGK